MTLASPRFDEKTEGEARPVVPIESAVKAEDATGRPRRPRGLMLAALLSAVLSAGATALYFNTGTTTNPAAPQTSPVSTPEAEVTPAQTEEIRDDVPEASEDASGRVKGQGNPPAAGVTDRDEREEVERRGRDEEKRAERARKEDERSRRDEEKAAERERKEAEKKIERGREAQKRGERKARLVDVITGGRKP